MRKIIYFVSLCFFISISINAQEKLDTIITIANQKMLVKVISISATVKYKLPGEEEIKSIAKKEVHKVIWANGRKENFSKLAFTDVGQTDYKAIFVTHKKKDVEGFIELGKIIVDSKGKSKSAKINERNALVQARKKAAKLGAVILYISEIKMIGGYKEIPKVHIEGIAYGLE